MNRTTVESKMLLFKEARHSVIIWWLSLLGLIILTLIHTSLFTARMWTAWDQSFLFLQQREAYDGVISGPSLWPNIALRLFPFFDLTRFDHSGWAVFILTYVTAIISASTVYFLSDKQERKKTDLVKYLFVFLLFLWPLTFGTLSNQSHVIWGTAVVGSLCYVPLQAFCCTLSLCFALLAVEDSNRLFWLYIPFSAFLSGLSLLIIPPGGVGCSILVFLLLIGYKYKYWYKVTLLFFLGFFLSMACVHFFVCPLPLAVNEMFSNATSLTSTSYGFVQLLILYCHCFRDGLLSALIVGGALYFTSKISHQLLGTIVYTILVLIGYYYFKTFITPAWLLFWGVAIALRRRDLSLKTGLLIIWPFVISLGTNWSVSSRMLCFSASWLFLLFDSCRFKIWRALPSLALTALLIVVGVAETSHYKRVVGTERFCTGSRNVALLSLSSKQRAFFEESKHVLDQYDYCPDSSVVFALSPDLCVCYAFDSKLSTLAYSDSRYIASDKSKMIAPDFLFLSSYDTLVIGGSLREASWGWPEEFDSYHVPAPDDYTDDRILFCRSRLLKEQ